MSTPESVSLGGEHSITTPVILSPYECDAIWLLRWSIDFSSLLARFLDVLPTESSHQKTVTLLLKWLTDEYQKGTVHLRFVETGEVISYALFKADVRYRDRWSDLWGTVAAYLLEEDESLILTLAERKELEQALDKTTAAAAHAIVQRLTVQEFTQEKERIVREDDELFIVDDWLYSRELYERAEREYTLGYIEIERRIILNYIRLHDGKIARKVPPSVLVEKLIDHWRNLVKQRQERLKRLRQMHASLVHQENERQMIKKGQYLYVALQQNRRWLREFLSR